MRVWPRNADPEAARGGSAWRLSAHLTVSEFSASPFSSPFHRRRVRLGRSLFSLVCSACFPRTVRVCSAAFCSVEFRDLLPFSQLRRGRRQVREDTLGLRVCVFRCPGTHTPKQNILLSMGRLLSEFLWWMLPSQQVAPSTVLSSSCVPVFATSRFPFLASSSLSACSFPLVRLYKSSPVCDFFFRSVGCALCSCFWFHQTLRSFPCSHCLLLCLSLSSTRTLFWGNTLHEAPSRRSWHSCRQRCTECRGAPYLLQKYSCWELPSSL